MAYRKRFYRGVRYATRTRRRSYKGIGFALNPMMLVGAAAGILAPSQDARLELGINALAVAPIQGRMISPVKLAAQGFVFGRIARALVPQLGGLTGGSSSGGNVI